MADFKINARTGLYNDPCSINLLNQTNTMSSQYHFPAYLSNVDPSRGNYFESVLQPGVFQTGNYAGFPSHVDDGSEIRNGKLGNIVTHGKAKRIFKTGSYLSPPYMGPKTAALEPDVMSKLYLGELTHDKGSLRGRNIDRFVPLLPEIESQIQNPRHLIPKYWVRGGMDTRVVIRNIDYLKTCGLKK